ncbi:tRNA pseudouridine synthase-like 1 isoform X2 [Rhinolophus ferrumequinum]|uniref:tRNA pseudouridine synthase-like 1 isoform X2 n=1 Tax=Rhinolophus ferrumequinum TaxID=59479 RepID=UPI00140F61A6|nr:tRNA pseudouridine synthase-like 1 isoform X2 [Rhinolophus ferrumequinum]XP_032969631.1 tRNA pseudouridine synthase-like 1 isoform X2 [Rhinolophus ferrumequinum]
MGSGPAAGTVRARYLVYFQYLGTDFNGVAAVRGAQRAVGVQNYLEEAAEKLKSVVPVKFVISSRTDAGVHALSNAAHLDVQRRSGQPPFSPEVLTQALNTHLKHPAIRCAPLCAPSSTAGRGGGQKGLRLDRTSWGNGTLVGRPPSGVPDLTPTGSCRPSVCTATSMPATQPHPEPTCTAWPPAAPGMTSCLCLNETDAGPCGQIIWMWPPCRRPRNTSWGLMTSAPSNRPAAHPLAQCAHCAEPPCPLTQPAPLSSPRRAVSLRGGWSVEAPGVEERLGTRLSWSPALPSLLPLPGAKLGWDITGTCVPRRLRFWTLEFESQSFLYRQVRRMTAILVAVGLGTLTPTEVKVILESRDPLGRHQTRVAPAHGLFLKSVLYGGLRDLAGNPSCAQQESQGPEGREAPGQPEDHRRETNDPKAGGLE